MTIPSTARKAGPLLGTGAQTAWPFTFKVFAESDIAVAIANALGVETALVLNTDYSVALNSNQETSPGGTVTYPVSGTPLAIGSVLSIVGDLDYDQPLDVPSGGNFSPAAIENELDRLTMQIQQLREVIGRSLLVPVTSDAAPALPFPEANQLIGWDATGDNLQNVPLSELATAVSFGTFRFDTFVGDGADTEFALTANPAAIANLDVAVDGLTMVPSTDYTLVSSTLVFSVAPAVGAEILARYGQALPITGPVDASAVTASNPQAPAYLKTVSDILAGSVVSIDRFLPSAEIAAIRAGTSTYNVAPDLNAALPSFTNGGGINAPRGRYYTTQAVVFGTNSKKIKFSTDGGAILFCAHTGHGLDLTSQNENYGGHIVEGWTIQGPNVAYPMSALELAGTSAGAGINAHDGSSTNAAVGYNLIIRDVEVKQFQCGMRLRAVLLSKYHNVHARFNQYGILVDGGQTNANDFFGPTIRNNRIAGIYSTGAAAGALTNATQNRIYGGILESNIPYRGDNPAGYAGGYRTARDLALGDGGHGVVLLNSYDWKIDGTYFENQNFDVWLGSSSDSNDFVFTRHGPGGGGRFGGFMFDGAGVVNNKVFGGANVGAGAAEVNVITNHADHARNQFLDTEGFNFIPANLVGFPQIRNNMLNQSGGGTAYGATTMPAHGYLSNPGEGTTAGTITGIGTAAATLNVFGLGEIELGSLITGATTITALAGGVPGQTLVIRNYQTTHTVILKSGVLDSDIFLLKNKRSVRLNKFGQQITLYCNGQSKWIEIGRNFSDAVQGYTQISGASTTVAVLFSTPSAGREIYEDEPDASYTALVSVSDAAGGAPAAGAWAVRIHAQTAAGFSISVQAAPGGATSFYYNWEAVR